MVAPTSNNAYGKDQFNLEGRGLLEGDTAGTNHKKWAAVAARLGISFSGMSFSDK